MKNEIEQIMCSGVWFKPKVDDGTVYGGQPTNITEGFVVCGLRHSSCFNVIKNLFPNVYDFKDKYREVEQGFVTTHNRFVDRVEAVEIALKSGQIKETKKQLFSEDLW